MTITESLLLFSAFFVLIMATIKDNNDNDNVNKS